MIIRKVKVTEYEYQAPINYVAGATEPDIQFQLTDYEIPSGATGRVYVGRSDGTFEYTVATISGNTVTVAPTSSMFSVKGPGAIQVTLYVGNEVVKNFAVPVYVHADLADDAAHEGSDVTGVFRAAEEEALADFQEQAEQIVDEVIEEIPADYTALTEEVSELNERLSDVQGATELAKIYFPIDGNGYINPFTGEIVATANYKHTDYIKLTSFVSISYKRIGVTQASSSTTEGGIAFYDESKNYLSGIRAELGQASRGYIDDLYSVQVPNNAAYARFSVLPETYGDFDLYGKAKLVNEIDVMKSSIASNIERTFTLTVLNSVSIESGSDLNDYTSIGNFHVANSNTANNILNIPEKSPGKLEVMATSDSNSELQLYFTNTNRLYSRRFNASGFSGWNQLIVKDDLSSYSALKASDYISIQSGSDLNDYTTVGNYCVASSTDAGNISNMPVQSTGKLVVMATATSNNLEQIYIDTLGSVYVRYKNALGWGDWKKIVVKDDLSRYSALSTSDYVTIQAESNLNDYTTVGNYVIAYSNVANSVVNIPVKAPGKLTVLTSATNNNVVQIYLDTNCFIYIRYKDGRGWGNWERLVVSTEAVRLSDTANCLMDYAQALIESAQYNIAFANAPLPIDLKNYVGNTQNVHPKVLYFDNGFGGHKYWMAYTPYPYMNDAYENPCIAYSDDGYVWTNIAGNPIDDPEGVGYNSDTHLVYRNDLQRLECWYRYVTTERVEEIYRQTSTDGVTWSTKEKILTSTDSGAANYLSPAINFDGTNYKIWVVDGNVIKYYTAPANNPGTWTLVNTFSGLAFVDDGYNANPWHLDVIEDNGTYIMLVMCQYGNTVSASSKWSLFICTSVDNVTYTVPTKVMGGSKYGWDKLLYRSSIVKVGNVYRIYYSGANLDRSFHISIAESATLSEFKGKYITA